MTENSIDDLSDDNSLNDIKEYISNEIKDINNNTSGIELPCYRNSTVSLNGKELPYSKRRV